jgi:hypothetical protein
MKHYFILFFIFILFSCKENFIKTNYSNIEFQYSKATRLSGIVSDIDYVALETNDSCLIGYAKQILYYKERFYVLDSPVGKAIYVFDSKGHFLESIKNVGQSAGEYVNPSFIAINEKDNALYVKDNMQNKLLVFDAMTLEYRKEYFLDSEFLSFCFLDNGNTIALYNTLNIRNKGNSYSSHIITTDTDYNIIKEMIPIEFATGYILNPFSPFFGSESEIFFSHPYKGNVYKLASTDCEPLFKFKFENHLFPPLDFLKRNASKKEFVSIIRGSEYINFFSFSQTNSHICVNLFASDLYYMSIYNKNSQKGMYFSINDLIDDIGFGFNIPSLVAEDYYYSILYPSKIIENANNGKLSEKFKKIIGEINAESNIVLLKYKIAY